MADRKTLEIVSISQLSDEQAARIKAVDKRVRLTVAGSRDASDISNDAWERAEVVLASGRFLPEPEKVPNLKWVQVVFAGVENALASPLMQTPGIITTSASGVMISQMGEYTLMALLMLGHKMPQIIRDQGIKKWGQNSSKALTPVELRGSTVGIVGYGSIGREVARLLLPFGATILAAKRDVMQTTDSGYTPEGLGDPAGDYFTRLYPIEALKGMLEECDFVVLAVPLTPETKNLFNAEIFAAMKPGSFFVNVSRGGVVDEAALEQALRSGKLGGAVLDVFTQEPLPQDNPLWNVPNLMVTPHVSGISAHYMDDVVDLFVTNLKAYLADEPLRNVVDPSKGY